MGKSILVRRSYLQRCSMKKTPTVSHNGDSSPSPTSDSSPSSLYSYSSPALPLPSTSLPLRPYRSAQSPRLRVALAFPPEGRTKQQFKDECDINRIMKRYQQTGVIDHVNRAQPRFGDLETVDFQTAMNLVIDAEQRFLALPAEVRDRFGNDPARLLAFVGDEKNRAEAVKLGLLDPPAAPVPPPSPASDRSTTGATANPGASSAPGSATPPPAPSGGSGTANP